MFLVQLKTLVVEAWRATLDADYPEVDFRGVWVSMEYPLAKANYPGVWVDFLPTADLQTAGIGHAEYVEDATVAGRFHRVGRWRYAGVLQMTCVALTSLERDRLVDELVRVMAFGRELPETAVFRTTIETNDLIPCQAQWDKFTLGAKGETPGTPWGTDEVVYEMTISVDCQGEFVSGGSHGLLIPISSVVVQSQAPGEPDPWV